MRKTHKEATSIPTIDNEWMSFKKDKGFYLLTLKHHIISSNLVIAMTDLVHKITRGNPNLVIKFAIQIPKKPTRTRKLLDKIFNRKK